METIEYIVNKKGKRKAVIIPYDVFKQLLERIQDSIDIALIKEVENEPTMDWEDFVKELRQESLID